MNELTKELSPSHRQAIENYFRPLSKGKRSSRGVDMNSPLGAPTDPWLALRQPIGFENYFAQARPEFASRIQSELLNKFISKEKIAKLSDERERLSPEEIATMQGNLIKEIEELRFGGAGYDARSRPDHSNTAFVLDALLAGGLASDDPAVQKALKFVSRSQNLKSQAFLYQQAHGGFLYEPLGLTTSGSIGIGRSVAIGSGNLSALTSPVLGLSSVGSRRTAAVPSDPFSSFYFNPYSQGLIGTSSSPSVFGQPAYAPNLRSRSSEWLQHPPKFFPPPPEAEFRYLLESPGILYFNVHQLENINAVDAARILDEMFNGPKPSGAGAAAPREDRLRIRADSHSNKLLFRANPFDTYSVLKLIAKIDQKNRKKHVDFGDIYVSGNEVTQESVLLNLRLLNLHAYGVNENLLYQRPTFSNDGRIFTDLLQYAPGLNTNPTDILAVLEAELTPDPKAPPGTIEPAAGMLIDKARSLGWSCLTLGDKKNPLKFHFNGAGHYRYERTLPNGLVEQVICDGTTLLHLYAEARPRRPAARSITSVVRNWPTRCPGWCCRPTTWRDSATWLSWIDKPSPWCRTSTRRASRVSGGRFKSPGKRTSSSPMTAGSANASSLRCRQERSLYRETYEKNGTIHCQARKSRAGASGSEFESATLKLDLASSTAPNLKPDTSKLVVVSMPLRTGNYLRSKVGDPDKMSNDEAISLIASACAEGNLEIAQDAITRSFHAKGDRRIGFCTLLSTTARALFTGNEWQQRRLAALLKMPRNIPAIRWPGISSASARANAMRSPTSMNRDLDSYRFWPSFSTAITPGIRASWQKKTLSLSAIT